MVKQLSPMSLEPPSPRPRILVILHGYQWRLSASAWTTTHFPRLRFYPSKPFSRLVVSQAHAFAVGARQQRGITLDVATAVTTEIARGPWSPEDKVMMATTLSTAACTGNPAPQVRKKQKLGYLELFLNQVDWAALQGQNLSPTAKLQVVANHPWRLGVTCPGEK
eukprot:8065027-Pyramimonas_sp.AAC.1